jgi:hypothetical protein
VGETFTLIDILHSRGITPDKSFTWTLGAILREAFREENDGRYPVKQLRQKTNAGGSHCFAIYPEAFRRRAESIVDRYFEAIETQQDLFGRRRGE